MAYVLITSSKESLVDEVLEHKPETWLPYLGERNGLFDIIDMEFSELQKIRQTRPPSEVVLALAHLAAAATYALNEMTC